MRFSALFLTLSTLAAGSASGQTLSFDNAPDANLPWSEQGYTFTPIVVGLDFPTLSTNSNQLVMESSLGGIAVRLTRDDARPFDLLSFDLQAFTANSAFEIDFITGFQFELPTELFVSSSKGASQQLTGVGVVNLGGPGFVGVDSVTLFIFPGMATSLPDVGFGSLRADDFVVQPSPPANDSCSNAIALPSTFAETAYDATFATTDGQAADGFCDYGAFGDEQNYNDVWFTYTPAVGGCTYISTLGLAAYDTRLTVYEGVGCPDDPANIIACVDDEVQPSASPFEAGLDVELVAGQSYTIRLGTFDAATSPGSGTLRIAPGPGAAANSGFMNPGAPSCMPSDVVSVPLNYNFNGIVHATEALSPDDPNGYRSVSDRGLDFQLGVPSDPLLDPYQLISTAGVLDIVHVGNRNTVANGNWAFDPVPDGDVIGTQPSWLTSADQDATQVTTLANPIPLGLNASLSFLYMVSDGGGTFDVIVDLSSDASLAPVEVETVDAPDWYTFFNPGFEGTTGDDGFTDGTGRLVVREGVVDLSSWAGQSISQILFVKDTPGVALTILAANVNGALVDQMVPGDACFFAEPISGTGNFAFDTTGATSAGPLDSLCGCGLGAGSVQNDVWFEWIAPQDGLYTVSTAGLAGGADTMIGVYENCGSLSIACNDDLGNSNGSESELRFRAVASQSYRVRIGTVGGVAASGMFSITTGAALPNVIATADFGGMSYDLLGISSWTDAQLAAEELGGNLVVIEDQAEQDFLFNEFGTMELWIGMSDRAVEGTFEWIDGTPVSYTNFEVGEPSETAPGEDFVHLASFFGGAWNDRPGCRRQNGVVERPGPFTETCSGDGGDQMGCTDCPCGNNAPAGTIGGCLNSASTSARLLPSGTASVTAADLRFEASGVSPNNSCVLTSGNALAPANVANPCFGLNSGIQAMQLDGLRCAVQGVLRHGVRPSNANGDVGVTTNGWGNPNGFFNFAAFATGSTKHFQIIYRDDMSQVCMRGQNTSQAVSLTFVD